MLAFICRCLQRRLRKSVVSRLTQLPLTAMARVFGSFNNNNNNFYSSSVFIVIGVVINLCMFSGCSSVNALGDKAPLTCTHEGLELKPGQFASTATDKCRLCYCDSHGAVQCKPLKNCPRPTWFELYDNVGNCLPVFAEGDCCPLDYVCECRQAVKSLADSKTKECQDCACNSYGVSRCTITNTTTLAGCQTTKKSASLLSLSKFANVSDVDQNSVHSSAESSSSAPPASTNSHDAKHLLDDGRQLLFQRQRPLEVVLVDSYSLPVVISSKTHSNSNNSSAASSSLLMRSYLLQHPETLLPGILVEQALAALRDSSINTIYIVIAGANSTSLSPLLTGPAIELLAESAVEKALVEMLTKSAPFAARIHTALASASSSASSSKSNYNNKQQIGASSSGGLLLAEGSSFASKFARRAFSASSTPPPLTTTTTTQQVAVAANSTKILVKIALVNDTNSRSNLTTTTTTMASIAKHPVRNGGSAIAAVSGPRSKKSANLMAPVMPLLQSVTYEHATADSNNNASAKRIENAKAHGPDFVLVGPTASPIDMKRNHYEIIEGGNRRGSSQVSKRYNSGQQQHNINLNSRVHNQQQQQQQHGGGYASSHVQRATAGGAGGIQQQPATQILKKNHSSALISPLLPALMGGDMLEKATSLASMQVAAQNGLGGVGGGGGGSLANVMQSFMGAALGGAGGVLGTPAAVSLAGIPGFGPMGGGGGVGGALGAVLNAAAAAGGGGGGAAGQPPLLNEEVLELMVDTMGSIGAASVLATALSPPMHAPPGPPSAPPVVINSYDPGFSSGTGNAIGGPGGMLQAMPRSNNFGPQQGAAANHQASSSNVNNAHANGGAMRVVDSAYNNNNNNPMQAPFSQHPNVPLYNNNNNNNNNNQSPTRNRRAHNHQQPRSNMNAWRRGGGYVDQAEMATTTKPGTGINGDSTTVRPSPASPMVAPSSNNGKNNNNNHGGISARSGGKRRAFGPVTLKHNFNSNAATAAAVAAAGPRPRNAPLAEGERIIGFVKHANISEATSTTATRATTSRPKQSTVTSHRVTNKKKVTVKTGVSSLSAKNKSQAFIDGSGTAALAAFHASISSTSATTTTTTTLPPPVFSDPPIFEPPAELLAMATTVVHEALPSMPNPNEVSAQMISVSTEPNAFDTALDAMLGAGNPDPNLQQQQTTISTSSGISSRHQHTGGHEVNANDQWTLVNNPSANEPLPVTEQALINSNPSTSSPGFVEPISPHKTTITPVTESASAVNVNSHGGVPVTGGNSAALDPFNDPTYLTSLLNTRAALINQAAGMGQQHTGGDGIMLNTNEGQIGGPKISLTGHKLPQMHFPANRLGAGGMGTSASFIFPGAPTNIANMLAPGGSMERAAVMMQMANGGTVGGAEALGAQLSSMLNAHLVSTGDHMTVAAINAGRSPVNPDAITDAIEEPIDNPKMHTALFGHNGLVSQANNARMMRAGGGGNGILQTGMDAGAPYTTRGGGPSGHGSSMGGLGGILQPETGGRVNGNAFGGAPLHTNVPSLLNTLSGMINGGGQRAAAAHQQHHHQANPFNAMANAAAMTSLMENMFLEPQMPSDKAMAAFQNEMMASMGMGAAGAGGMMGGGGGGAPNPLFEGDVKPGISGMPTMPGGMNPVMMMSLMNGVGGGRAAQLNAGGGGGGGMVGGVGGLGLGMNPFGGPMQFAEMRVANTDSAASGGPVAEINSISAALLSPIAAEAAPPEGSLASLAAAAAAEPPSSSKKEKSKKKKSESTGS